MTGGAAVTTLTAGIDRHPQGGSPMRCYWVEVRRPGSTVCELIRANGHRDAQKLAESVRRDRYQARIITTKRR
jgi:hypothetical protein